MIRCVNRRQRRKQVTAKVHATTADKITGVQDICMWLPYLMLTKINAVRLMDYLLQTEKVSRRRITERASQQ